MADAYKSHRVGSNKGKVHEVFDKQGREAAMKKAKALGIMDTTARTWTSAWARGEGKAKAKKSVKRERGATAKKTVKKTAKKAPAKKVAKKAAPKTEMQAAA